MAERGPVIRAGGAGQRRTLVITRPDDGGGVTDTPDVTPGDGTPSGRVPSASTSQAFGESGSQRTLTVHGANAAVPLYFGGPQVYGGFLIAYAKLGNFHYFDVAWGEGPINSIGSHKFGNSTGVSLGIFFEDHLGVAGDTTSTRMSEAIGGYTIPEFIAHTVFKVEADDSKGDFSPMDLTVKIEGMVGWNFIDSAYEYSTGDPFMAVWEMLTNPRQGNNDMTTRMNLADFTAAYGISSADIGGGEIRWQIAMRLDTQDTLQNQIINVLSYAFGHLRFNDGQFGVWVDWVKDRALDNAGNWPIYTDNFDDQNLNQNVTDEITVTRKGRGQIPTVVTGTYSDASQMFVDASGQHPSSVSGDWREQQYAMPGITLRTRMLRWLQTTFRLSQKDKEARIPANYYGVAVLGGDRIGVNSRRLIGSGASCPNAGAAPGIEEMIAVEQSIQGAAVVLTGELYRDSDFEDVLSDDDSGPPTPTTGGGNADPDPPSSVTLTNVVTQVSGVPKVEVKIEWVPADMGYPTDTQITYSRDDGINFHVLGYYDEGPVFLPNPTLGVEHEFRLFTRRKSTGQLSATYIEGDIVPTYTDASIPEITQLQFLENKLRWAGPLSDAVFRAGELGGLMPPAPALNATVSHVGFAGCDPGDHGVAFARVFDGMGDGLMGPRTTVTTDLTNNRIDIIPLLGQTVLDPDAVAGLPFAIVRELKIYMTKSIDDPVTGPLYLASEDDPASGGDEIQTADADLIDNLIEPVLYEGVSGWAVYDAWGIADPTIDPMPLFKFIEYPHVPHRWKTLDCTPIAHQDTDGKFKIHAYITVVKIGDGSSVGRAINNDNAVGIQPAPPDSVPAHVLVVDGVNDNLDIPVDASYVYLDDGGLTADWSIGGFTVQGATPTTRKRIVLMNTTTFYGSLDAFSGGSSAGNQIAPPGSGTYNFGFTNGSATIEYDVENAVWKIIATNGVGFGPSGGGFGFIWNRDTAPQVASFWIDEIGVVGVLGQGVGSMAIVDGDNDELPVTVPSLGAATGVITLVPGSPLTGPATIRSILLHGNLPGVKYTLVNETGFDITLQNAWAGASSFAAIHCKGGVDLVIPADAHSAVIIENTYTIFPGGWIVSSKNF